MTKEEYERVMRIVDECNGRPPKRIYPDDALFLVELAQRYYAALIKIAKSGDKIAMEIIKQ